MAVPISKSYSPDNQSSAKYAASQKPSVAGNLTLTAAAAATDSQGLGRIIGISSDGSDSGRTFTITGLDEDGQAASENVTGPASGTSVSTKFYTSITSIAVDAGTAGNITAGNVNTTLSAATKCLPLSVYQRVAPQIEVDITGTANWTVKETFTPLITGGSLGLAGTTTGAYTSNTQNAVWYAKPTALQAQTGNAFAQSDIGVRAVKLYINSYTNGAKVNININSPTNSGEGG